MSTPAMPTLRSMETDRLARPYTFVCVPSGDQVVSVRSGGIPARERAVRGYRGAMSLELLYSSRTESEATPTTRPAELPGVSWPGRTRRKVRRLRLMKKSAREWQIATKAARPDCSRRRISSRLAPPLVSFLILGWQSTFVRKRGGCLVDRSSASFARFPFCNCARSMRR